MPDFDIPEQTDGARTEATVDDDAGPAAVRRFQLTVVEGPNERRDWESAGDHCAIGSHPSNELVIDDSTVSRFHCEVTITSRGAVVRDLESRNGTILDGVPVVEAFARGGSLLRIGRTVLRFQFANERNRLPLSSRTEFGSLVGTSVAMRTTFALLERAATSDATVLLEGETGTGKEGAAEAVHQAGARRDHPLVVVDCSAIPENLLESELFGHERGAFTGAAVRRIGAFEEASTGTLFLDEVGELSSELQPKLLRALEQREIRRVGSNTYIPIDVRVIAATNRDLRAEVNAARFRADLYYRLAVVKVLLPSLRSRPEDIPVLAERILHNLGQTAAGIQLLRTPGFIESLQRAAWPGNVRELRNYLERCLVFQEPLPVSELAEAPPSSSVVDHSRKYEDERRRTLDEFERKYIEGLVHSHSGNISKAARAAGIDRAYVHRLMRRHNIRG